MSSDQVLVARLRHFFGDFIGWNGTLDFLLFLPQLLNARRNSRKIMQSPVPEFILDLLLRLTH